MEPSVVNRLNTLLALMLLLLLTATAYWSGLYGDFMFDDAYAVRDNTLLRIDALDYAQLKQAALALPAPSFWQSRWVAMLTFGLNHYFTQLDTLYFKATNLVLHLLTGLALFFLTRALLRLASLPLPLSHARITGISLVVTAVWLLHPLHVSTVLYIVQRMAILSSLFSVLAMLSYVHGRTLLIQGQQRGWVWLLTAVPLLMGLAFFSKENGLLIPVFLLAIEMLVLQFCTAYRWQRHALQLLFGLGVVLPLLWMLLWVLTHWPEMAATYAGRDFTLEERLLTQARVVWFYLGLVLLPAISVMGMFHDDFPLSTSVWMPWTTSLALVAWPLVVGLLVHLRRTAPLLLLGLLFFLIGHMLESTVFALELIFEHRNYLASFGLIFGLVATVGDGRLYAHKPKILLAMTGALLVLLLVMTHARSYAWGNSIRMYVHETINHPNSLRANFKLGTLLATFVEFERNPELKTQYYQEARRAFTHITALNPDYSDGLFGLIVLNLNAGQPVEPQWVAELAKRLEFSLFNAQNVTIGQFSFLVQCQMAGGCRLSRSEMETIFSATLRNPTLPYTGRAGVASAYRAYYAYVVKDFDLALRYGQEAAAAWPQWLTYRLKLAELYGLRREPERAWAELAAIRAADTAGRFGGAIAETERVLQALFPASVANPAPVSASGAEMNGK